MERLSGLDASFLYGETPETPTHTAPLWIFEPKLWPSWLAVQIQGAARGGDSDAPTTADRAAGKAGAGFG